MKKLKFTTSKRRNFKLVEFVTTRPGKVLVGVIILGLAFGIVSGTSYKFGQDSKAAAYPQFKGMTYTAYPAKGEPYKSTILFTAYGSVIGNSSTLQAAFTIMEKGKCNTMQTSGWQSVGKGVATNAVKKTFTYNFTVPSQKFYTAGYQLRYKFGNTYIYSQGKSMCQTSKRLYIYPNDIGVK